MAKLKLPLLSESASGSIKGRLTFSKRKTGNQARYQRGQKDYVNPARAKQRGYFQTATGWWGEMTTEEQAGFAGYDERDP